MLGIMDLIRSSTIATLPDTIRQISRSILYILKQNRINPTLTLLNCKSNHQADSNSCLLWEYHFNKK